MIGLLWPLLSWPSEVRSKRWPLLLGWSACCLGTAVFPLLSVHQEENLIGMSVPPSCLCDVNLILIQKHSTTGAIAIYLIGVVGIRTLEFNDPQETRLFKTVAFILVRAPAVKFCALRRSIFSQLNGLGWSVILVNLVVRDLRDKKGVMPVFRILGWALFGTFACAPLLPACAFIRPHAVSTALVPFVLRVGRSNPHARLLSFFLSFSVCFIWLAIGFEGLFYVSYSLTLCLWVEVESALWTHTRAKSSANATTNARTRSRGKQDPSAYRPKADDLRIAVFFLFFVQVAFFGTGK